jgi:hypothetical protein
MLKKTVLMGAAALTIAGSMTAFAQRLDRRHEDFRRGPQTAEDRQAFADARLAALKAGLSLTEAQAANWPAFEQAVHDMQKLRLDRMKARAEQRNNPPAQPADPAERLSRRGTAMVETGAALKKLADATDALYKSLDDNQKRRFVALSRIPGLRDFSGARGDRDVGRRRGFHGRHERDYRGDQRGRDFRRYGFREDRDSDAYERRGRSPRGDRGDAPEEHRR